MEFFREMDPFLSRKEESVFLLKGYAGTGKTSIVQALVQALPSFNFKFRLLAPTGRASKVMASYADRRAFTIHKIIYKAVYDADTGRFQFALQKTYDKNTVFVVDEASMLSDRSDARSVLDDLLTYVFSGKGNKLILIGDTAQLPPVGQSESTALSADYYRGWGFEVSDVLMTDVQRQELNSGILKNATALRDALGDKSEHSLQAKDLEDVYALSSQKMEDGLRYAYDKYGSENTVIICRSNKQAVMYNQFIRRNLFYHEEEISAGDTLMIIKNNYFHIPPDARSGFLANGDFLEVRRVSSEEEQYGYRFADLDLKLLDQESDIAFSAKVMLDTLYTDSTGLTTEQSRDFYHKVSESYSDIENDKKRREALAEDPYLNALQIKFAYALTCHKSQGGQWDAVFVDQGFVKPEGMKTEDHIRWLYTAVTRATKELYLVNFRKDQFGPANPPSA